MQVRFWGIDSGIRHFVGGAGYGSVRVGTFMGRTILRSIAAAAAAAAASDGGGRGAAAVGPAAGGGAVGGWAAGAPVPRTACKLLLGEPEPAPSSAVATAAGAGKGGGGSSNPPIVNLPPSLYKEVFEQRLPEGISGGEFLERWGHHNDPVTKIDKEVRGWFGSGQIALLSPPLPDACVCTPQPSHPTP